MERLSSSARRIPRRLLRRIRSIARPSPLVAIHRVIFDSTTQTLVHYTVNSSSRSVRYNSGLHPSRRVSNVQQAFLVVLGQNGLLVDDCTVFPAEPPARPTTIPLANHSTLEIHSKRFRFEYPPKHARAAAAAALSTPAPLRRRLSLITASKVFSPAPSSRPMENLRVLQSPLRPYAGMVRQSSPLRGRGGPPSPADEDVEDEEVVLVDGDHPSVVQEDKDLVIMEEVQGPAPTSTQPQHLAPQAVRDTMRTPPRRRPAGRPSLHRAVLIRSAQRVAIDRAEEMEVEESMFVGEDPSDESDGLVDLDEDEEYEYEDEENEVMEEGYERLREGDEHQPMLTGWRQSLGSVWPFGRKSEEPEEPHDSTKPMVAETSDDDAQVMGQQKWFM